MIPQSTLNTSAFLILELRWQNVIQGQSAANYLKQQQKSQLKTYNAVLKPDIVGKLKSED